MLQAPQEEPIAALRAILEQWGQQARTIRRERDDLYRPNEPDYDIGTVAAETTDACAVDLEPLIGPVEAALRAQAEQLASLYQKLNTVGWEHDKVLTYIETLKDDQGFIDGLDDAETSFHRQLQVATKQVAALTQERDGLRQEVNQYRTGEYLVPIIATLRTQIKGAAERANAAEAALARCRAALSKYGHHIEPSEGWGGGCDVHNIGGKCTCGLEAARSTGAEEQ